MDSNSQQEKPKMQTLIRTTGAVLTLAAAVALMPSNANAQEPAVSDLDCTARVSPAQIKAGAEAVRVTVTFSEAIGRVTGVEQDNADGISIASPMDAARASSGTANPAPTSIQMGTHDTTWTVWLNTSVAEEGTHSVYFVAAEHRCAAEVEVVVPRD